MKLLSIANEPTTLVIDGENKYHENILRNWHILNAVDELLEADTPQSVILGLMRELRAAPGVEEEFFTNRFENELKRYAMAQDLKSDG